MVSSVSSVTLLQLVHACYLQKSSQQPPSSERLPLQQQSPTSSVATPRTTQHQLSSSATGQEAKIGRLQVVTSLIDPGTHITHNMIHTLYTRIPQCIACHLLNFTCFVKIVSTQSLSNQLRMMSQLHPEKLEINLGKITMKSTLSQHKENSIGCLVSEQILQLKRYLLGPLSHMRLSIRVRLQRHCSF